MASDSQREEKQTLLEKEAVSQQETSPKPKRGLSKLLLVYGCSFLLALAVTAAWHGGPFAAREDTGGEVDAEKGHDFYCDHPTQGYRCSPERAQLWGQYSPYFSVPSEIPDTVPGGCEITFAQILSRHGARDPTLKRTLKYSSTIVRIQATVTNLTGKYEFLKRYRYKLGADQLNEFGRQQMRYSGSKFYFRYRSLAKSIVPFIRASGQKRVVDSADEWMEGFHQAKQSDKSAEKDQEYPYDKVIIYEGPEFNNTLDHSRCINIEDGPLSMVRKDAKDAWINVYGPPILSRLRADLPEAGLEMDDIHNLMSMCPFDTVRTKTGTVSPFCNLFTQEEWQQYNQLESIEKFYGWGKGNPLGPSQGVGFTNELIARMTNKPVKDETSTNSTLDSNPKTFPTGGKYKLFADFSHDNDLTSAFFAMGLYNSTPMLSITQIDSIDFTRGWSSAWTVPFAARGYFEKMKCDSNKDDELVRIVVNDRVIPMETCGADELGRCTLSAFVDSLSFARQGGRWDQCFLDSSALDFELPSSRLQEDASS